MTHWIKEITLTGTNIELVPLKAEHASAFSNAAADGELWKLWYTHVPTPENTRDFIQDALIAKQNNGDLPFVIRDIKSQKIIGATRYCHVDNHHKRVEIGYTWYSKSFQRTGANTECKLLLLTHAFEQLNAIAVEFRTHWFNQQSRVAILRLGAKQDGVLRNHQQLKDGSLRDTVVFSIIKSEWPCVKKHLTEKPKDMTQNLYLPLD